MTPVKSKTPQKRKTKKATRGKRKLNISQIHWGFPPVIGGVETHLAIMLPNFVKRGHRTSLLTATYEGRPIKSDYKGVEIHSTPLMDLNWLIKRGFAGLQEEICEIFTKYIEETKPDIIHAHNMHYFSKTHAAVLTDMAKKKGVPVVLTAHNVWDENLYLELTRDIPWKHIIAVSHFIKSELVGIGIENRRCTVIHHGIDHHTFHPKAPTKETYKKYPQLKGKRLIFHPARMGLAKGVDVSIKAFNEVHKRFPDTMLVLAGTKNIIDWAVSQQKEIAYFVSLIKFFDLQDHILIDSYSIDQMPGLYAASDIVLYPSTAMEPFGLTMLESMSTARPIIVTRVGGMPEIIQDGINGFVIPIKNFEWLAGCISRLLAEDSLREQFGLTGRQMVERQFTVKHMTDQHLDVYKKVLK